MGGTRFAFPGIATAAQRVVGATGGFRLKIPPALVRFIGTVRNVIVFSALYGITLQWFLAVLTLGVILAVHAQNYLGVEKVRALQHPGRS